MDLLSTDQRKIIKPVIDNKSSTMAGLRAMTDHELDEAVRTFRELWSAAADMRNARGASREASVS